MAYRDFDDVSLDRRALLRGGALFGAARCWRDLPMSASLRKAAHRRTRPMWPAVSALMAKYADARKVANIVAAMGWGQQAPDILAQGHAGHRRRRLPPGSTASTASIP